MTFDSISFLFFLSITWSGYWLLHKNCRAQNALLHSFGFNAHLPLLKLILTIGLSFYTFQSIGYTLDVSRGKIHSACKTTGTEPTPFTLAVP